MFELLTPPSGLKGLRSTVDQDFCREAASFNKLVKFAREKNSLAGLANARRLAKR